MCVLEKTFLQTPVEGTASVVHYVAKQSAVNITWNYYWMKEKYNLRRLSFK